MASERESYKRSRCGLAENVKRNVSAVGIFITSIHRAKKLLALCSSLVDGGMGTKAKG